MEGANSDNSACSTRIDLIATYFRGSVVYNTMYAIIIAIIVVGMKEVEE